MRAGQAVTEAVREIISRNRSIYDCIKMDIVNYTALAVKIQDEVERHMNGPVNLNTIVVAIKRYGDSFEESKIPYDEAPLKDARLSLTDRIREFRFDTNEYPRELVEKISNVTKDYDLIRTFDSFRILTEDLDEVRSLIEDIPGAESTSNVGLVRIKIVVTKENRKNIGSYVMELLYNNGIEFIDAYFTHNSMVIIFDREDASRAYDVLRTERE